MIPKRKGSYKTTFAVFFFLLSIILIVFAVTRAVQTPKAKGALSYEQLIAKVKTTPSEVEEISLIENEPIAFVKLKNNPSKMQIVMTPELKSALQVEASKSNLLVKVEPLQENSTFWWEVRMPGFSVGGP